MYDRQHRSEVNVLKEYFCAKGNTGCVGYKNGQCISIENCQWQKSKPQEKTYTKKEIIRVLQTQIANCQMRDCDHYVSGLYKAIETVNTLN